MRFRLIAFAMLASASVIATPVLAQASEGVPVMQPYDGYILGVNDELEVSILNGGTTQSLKSRVKEDGTITVPFIGSVQATGQTARQLAQEITRQLKTRQIFNNPIVGVEVVQFVSRSATIIGQVSQPGIYPLDVPLTIGSALGRAGGATGGAADFLILRRQGEEHRIPLSTAIGEWSTSTRILAGDEIYVPTAPVVYIYGQVGSAGAFTVKGETTVRQALARAGGPTLAGSQKNISLYRGGERIKKIDLEETLQDGDVLYIHERLL